MVGDVVHHPDARQRLLELETGLEIVLPLRELRGDVVGFGGQPCLLEEVVAVIEGEGTCIHRVADQPPVQRLAGFPFPVEIEMPVFLGAHLVQVHELVGVGEVTGDVVVQGHDIGDERLPGEGGVEPRGVVAANELVVDRDAGVSLFEIPEELGIDRAVPVPEDDRVVVSLRPAREAGYIAPGEHQRRRCGGCQEPPPA
jgi:hypothetical protein